MTLWEGVSFGVGLLLSVGSLVTVTVPRFRRWLGEWCLAPEKKKEWQEQLALLHGRMDELLEKEKARAASEAVQREVDLCILRDRITHLYYKRLREKKLYPYESEDLHALYALYCKRGGNSYVHTLFRQMTEEWETKE